MEKHKTDESVKAGLQIEADGGREKKDKNGAANNMQLPADKEIDADDAVHDPDFEPTAEFNKENSEAPGDHVEKDADDQVHGK
jgi:hypothetical protein